jgi:hypothetical protein
LDGGNTGKVYIHGHDVDSEFRFDRYRIATKDGKDVLVGCPHISIEKAESTAFTLEVEKNSRGKNYTLAQKNAEEISCDPSVKDSLVSFQSGFVLPSAWRNQQVDITLKVPVGKTIYIDQKIREYIYDMDVNGDWSYDDMTGKYWMMNDNGLSLVNRAVPAVKPVKK